MALTLNEAKALYPREWIAFQVEEEKENLEQALGQVLDHHADRRELHRRLRGCGVKEVYINFSGPLIRPGYEVMFLCVRDYGAPFTCLCPG